MKGPARPRLAVVYPHELIGENAGLLDLHVRSLEELLEPLGWIVDARSLLDPGFARSALDADLAVIQMLGASEIEAVIRLRRELGRPTIFELTDNPLGVGKWLPSTHFAHSPLARQGIVYHAHLSDALQVLMPDLASLFAAVNPRAIVLSTYVPIPATVPPKPPGFVFGWSGSTTHAECLAAAAPVVTEFCRRHPEARFAYMGDRAMFDELFGAVPPEQREVHPFSDQAGHLRFVSGLHVGLAPMAPTPFNATRADTRPSLYAGHGVAAVLQDAPTHRAHHGHARIYTTARELLDTLEELFADRGQVEDMARRAREWAVSERNARTLGEERDRAYRELLAAAPESRAAGPLPPRDDAQLAARLADARRRDPEEALARCLELVAEAPSYEQAHVLAVQSLERLGRQHEALEYAERLRPSPVYADVFAELQARIAARIRPGERHRHVAKIASPFRRARLETDGPPAKRSRAVLEHQPYDYFALASTIRRLRRQGPASPQLAELYERACLVAPQEVPADCRPSRLAPFLPA